MNKLNPFRFYVFKCSNCSHIQVKEIRGTIQGKTFKCQKCAKTKQIKHKKNYGLELDHYGAYEVTQANKVASEWKKQLNSNNIKNEFHTYKTYSD